MIRLPTSNEVSQTAEEHGYPATDYSFKPDPNIYAPVTGQATAGGNPNEGSTDKNDCGWMIEQVSDDGKYKLRLCHAKRTSWTKKHFSIGDVMGIIGATGYTRPTGARHIHLVLFIKDAAGSWVRVSDPDKYIRTQGGSMGGAYPAFTRQVYRDNGYELKLDDPQITNYNGQPFDKVVKEVSEYAISKGHSWFQNDAKLRSVIADLEKQIEQGGGLTPREQELLAGAKLIAGEQ